MRANLLIALGVLIAAFAGGCAGRGEKAAVAQRKPPYLGPTDTMRQVVADINANNERLPSLWARHEFEATVVDERGKSRFVNGDGYLLFRQPRELRLIGKKPGVGNIFEIGSNDERFWLTIRPPNEPSEIWWGNYANLGKPCVEEIPIRPDLILEVLGVSRIETDFTREPAPTMRFNNDQDAYMFVWNVRGPDRWIAQKEVWYDRETKLPRLVNLFDENGRVILSAYLSKHQPITTGPAGAAGGEIPPPMIATDYRLFFPDNGTRMWFQLKDMELQHNGVPNDRSFAFPENPGVDREIQIDESCDD